VSIEWCQVNSDKSGITGIILAGGKSSRFGKDKALIKLNNKSLLEISVEKMQLFCDTILISYNSRLPEHISCKQVSDKVQDIGPMGGISACLEASETDKNFVLSVDTPFIPLKLCMFIINNTGEFDVVVPQFNGRIYPLIGLYSKSFLKVLEEDIKNKRYKMMKAVEKSKHSVVQISKTSEFYNEFFFMNINTREDLKAAKKYLS
jgi:molybdopterin-guanine dinucleotide biosynthesis protein A